MNIVQCFLNSSFNYISNRYYKEFQRDIKNAEEINKSVLMEILNSNKSSRYGELYDFASIKTVEDYKKMVPITSYSNYESFVESVVNGEKNILTNESVEFFGLSSGTTGKQKYIPVTATGKKITNNYMTFLNQALINNAIPKAKKGGRGLFLVNISKPSKITPSGIPAGAGTSEGIKSMKKILPYIWISPLEVLEISNQQTANYLHALFALKDENLSYIVSQFPSNIVQMFGVMEKNYKQLINDIKSGTISEHLDIDSETKMLLEKKIKPDVKRALKLEKEFKNGSENIAKRIWPNINYVGCVAGGSFSIYTKKLKFFIGDTPIYSAVYGATEGLIGMAVKPDTVSYVVVPRASYFEFIPLNEQDSVNPDTLNLNELKIGESYEVVITNYSGFYRYRLGDIIKVVDYYEASPVIEFLYRKGQLLNIAAEKTQESAVQYAVNKASEKWGVDTIDYTVIQDLSSSIGCYKFYIETSDNNIIMNDLDTSRKILEEALYEGNPRYLVGINNKKIAPLKLELVKKGTFQKLKEELLKKGASINQVKVPRVINDEKLILLLEKNKEYMLGEVCYG